MLAIFLFDLAYHFQECVFPPNFRALSLFAASSELYLFQKVIGLVSWGRHGVSRVFQKNS